MGPILVRPCIIFLMLLSSWIWTGSVHATVSVFVTVPAHQKMVSMIGGPYVHVESLLTPQMSDELYEPTIAVVKRFSRAHLWVLIGPLPIERHLQSRLSSLAPKLRTVSLLNSQSGIDPHVWLSLSTTQKHLQLITNALCKIDPLHASYYQKNATRYSKFIAQTEGHIRSILVPLKGQAFIIGHPSLGYFSKEYGLLQLAIDHHQGKPPTPTSFSSLLREARHRHAKVIIVQKDTPASVVESVVNNIPVRRIYFEPMSENYPHNLVQLAHDLSHSK